MLLIEDMQVEIAGKLILQHIDLEIQPGETHILFGPMDLERRPFS